MPRVSRPEREVHRHEEEQGVEHYAGRGPVRRNQFVQQRVERRPVGLGAHRWISEQRVDERRQPSAAEDDQHAKQHQHNEASRRAMLPNFSFDLIA